MKNRKASNTVTPPILQDVAERFVPFFAPGARAIVLHGEDGRAVLKREIGVTVDADAALPATVVLDPTRKRLIVIELGEAGSGLTDMRINTLEQMFSTIDARKFFVTAYPSQKTAAKAMALKWADQARLWFADEPTHMICFDENNRKGFQAHCAKSA